MDRTVYNLSSLMFQKEGTICSFSFENPMAEKGNAAKTESELGPSRKGTPFIRGFYPGTTVTLADITGPGVIRQFFLTVTDLPGGGSLEKVILRMYWDDEEQTAVECPLGAFFCCVDGTIRDICSVPIVVVPARSFHCYFPMPFRKRARVTLENRYDQEISIVAYQVTCTADHMLPENIQYFHAKQSRENTGERLVWPGTYKNRPLMLPDDLYQEEDIRENIVDSENRVVYWYQIPV